MAKILECNKVDPSSGCKHIIRGETEEDVLQKAAEHAKLSFPAKSVIFPGGSHLAPAKLSMPEER